MNEFKVGDRVRCERSGAGVVRAALFGEVDVQFDSGDRRALGSEAVVKLDAIPASPSTHAKSGIATPMFFSPREGDWVHADHHGDRVEFRVTECVDRMVFGRKDEKNEWHFGRTEVAVLRRPLRVGDPIRRIDGAKTTVQSFDLTNAAAFDSEQWTHPEGVAIDVEQTVAENAPSEQAKQAAAAFNANPNNRGLATVTGRNEVTVTGNPPKLGGFTVHRAENAPKKARGLKPGDEIVSTHEHAFPAPKRLIIDGASSFDEREIVFRVKESATATRGTMFRIVPWLGEPVASGWTHADGAAIDFAESLAWARATSAEEKAVAGRYARVALAESPKAVEKKARAIKNGDAIQYIGSLDKFGSGVFPSSGGIVSDLRLEQDEIRFLRDGQAGGLIRENMTCWAHADGAPVDFDATMAALNPNHNFLMEAKEPWEIWFAGVRLATPRSLVCSACAKPMQLTVAQADQFRKYDRHECSACIANHEDARQAFNHDPIVLAILGSEHVLRRHVPIERTGKDLGKRVQPYRVVEEVSAVLLARNLDRAWGRDEGGRRTYWMKVFADAKE